MEKKTIGSFIAALRKANGMTQQQLADGLNVSNKSISRWERDESLPDLTLIPVIAELFGITSDELLKGERNTNESESKKPSPKIDIQIKRILDSNMTKFKTLSYISFAIVFIGVIITLVCGYAFYKAVLGFGLGIAFFIISLLMEVISATYSLSAVNSDDFEGNKLFHYRRTVLKYLNAVIYTNVVAIASCAPFILIRSHYYVNSIINFSSWIKTLPYCFAIAFAINVIISIISSKIITIYHGTFLGEDLTSHLVKKTRLKFKYSYTILILIFITFLGQVIFDKVTDSGIFAKEPIEEINNGYNEANSTDVISLITDAFNNQQTSNQQVSTDYDETDQKNTIINDLFIGLYFTEIAIGSVLYYRKRKNCKL